MTFDAGSIEASLAVRLDQFNQDLDKAEARVRKFESEKHEVRVSAVFDSASLTRARKAFADLDTQISRDAANRLRSSPQGSVLGSLNALFSPHPVAGSPSPQQSGQQGLLGKMFTTPGAGGGTTGAAPGPAQQRNSLGQFIGGGGGGSGGGGGGGGLPGGGGGNNNSSFLSGLLTRMTGSVKTMADNSNKQSGLLGKLLGGDRSGGGFASGLAGGIGPGILGVSAAKAAKIGLGGSLLGALPATFAGLGALGIGGAGAGVLALGAKTLIGSQNQAGQAPTQGVLYDPAQKALASLQSGLKNSVQVLVKPLEQVFGEIPKLVKSIEPALKDMFSGAATLAQPLLLGIGDLAKTILPLLGKAFAAVAPLMRPMLDGLGGLLTGLLPGLITLLKGAQPAVSALFGGLAIIGKGLGQMFTAFAPVVKDSAVILNALLSVISALFPIIGQLAAVFASALAPAFAAFAGTIKSLLPFLTVVGQILSSLAAAVLGDLVAAFTSLAQLLTDIAPSLKIVGDVLSQVFTTLENSGVFAVLGDTLENLVKPLASLINLLVGQLAPFLPVIIGLVSQFATILIQLLSAGLASVLSGITWLLTKMPWLVPLIASITAGVWLFNAALAANPIGLVVIAIVGLIGAVTLLVTHWHQVWTDIKTWAEDAWSFIWNGFGKYLLPLLGPVGLIALGAIELYQHWSQIWGDIKQVGLDFYQWIWNDFGAKIGNFLTKTLPNAFTSAVNAISDAWGAIENVFKAPVNFLINTVYMGGIRRFWDDVMGAIGLSSLDLPVVTGLAAGGVITSGSGPTSDDVLIRASRGETVVSAAHSAVLAPMFAAVGVPGYATGGIVGGIAGQILSSAVSAGVKDLGNELLKLIGVEPGTGGSLAKMMVGIPTSMIGKAANWALGAIGLGGGGGPYPAGGGGVAANMALAKLIAPQWAAGALWNAWNYVGMRESGWSQFATNPTSGAYGIPQALPYTKMPKMGWPAFAGGSSDPAVQIGWMVQYMQSVYGGPLGAAAHEKAFNWYGNGLDAIFNHPTVIGVGERGPEAVSVTPMASFGRSGGGTSAVLGQLIAAVRNERPVIGTYQTAYYGTGDTAYALRELTSTMRTVQLQSVVVEP